MNIFVNSIPKSGTNLLQRLLDLSGAPYSGRSVAASSSFGRFALVKQWLHRPGVKEVPIPIGLEVPAVVSPSWLRNYLHQARGYVTGHAQYTTHLSHLLASEGYKTIQIFRHPCAVLVSWAHYIERPDYYWQEAGRELAGMPLQDRMLLMAQGGMLGNIYYTGLAEIIRKAEGWLRDRNTLVIRFEDLVGPKGGGSDIAQKNTIQAVLEYAGLRKSNSEMEAIRAALFGRTRTFRNGQVDGWKRVMDGEMLASMQAIFAELDFMRQLDYDFEFERTRVAA